MIYRVYKWEWDEEPGFFHGRWVRAFETNNEEMMRERITELQESSWGVSTTKGAPFAKPPVAIFETMEAEDYKQGVFVA